MKEKAKILDKEAVSSALVRIAHEIIEKNKGTQMLSIIGIRNRGAHLAKRLADIIAGIEQGLRCSQTKFAGRHHFSARSGGIGNRRA